MSAAWLGLAVVLAALAALGLVWGLGAWIVLRVGTAGRQAGMAAAATGVAAAGEGGSLGFGDGFISRGRRWWQDLGRWSEQTLGPLLPSHWAKRLSRDITKAGGLGGLSAPQFTLVQLACIALGVCLGLVVAIGRFEGQEPEVLLGGIGILVAGGALTGLLWPLLWLRERVRRRHAVISAQLPYHLDLLTLCVEAGLDFTAGVGRMVEKGQPGPLHDEFRRYLAAVRVGKTRAQALEAMAQRIGLPAVTMFVSALVQAERLGSGLGRTLRAQAEQLRLERFQRAEKAAQEAPVKMLFPLVLFVFPTIWFILAAPLVFEWLFR